jgi:hypothetical protein
MKGDSYMKKTLAIVLISSFLTCTSLFATDEDRKIGYPDNDKTCYQNDNEEDFKNVNDGETEDFKIVDDGEPEVSCEKIGYTDDQ